MFKDAKVDEKPGPIVLKALATLVDDDEMQGQEDITVIGACIFSVSNITALIFMVSGAIDENGVPVTNNRMEKAEALRIPDSSLRVIQHCKWANLGILASSILQIVDHPIS
jgi:hypothetical protein